MEPLRMRVIWLNILLQLNFSVVLAGVDWPVFFENLGAVNSIHNKWDLTFSIETNFQEFEHILDNFQQDVLQLTPTFPPEDLSESAEKIGFKINTERNIDDALEISRESIFLRVKEHWEKVSKSLLRRADSMKAKVEDIKSLGDNRVVRQQQGEGREKKKTTWTGLEARNRGGKRGGEKDRMYGKKRVKRQFGGPGLLQLLFGVAYTDNVEKVKSDLEDIERRLNKDVGNLVNEQNRATNKLETRISDTDVKVVKVEGMTSNLEAKLEGMERNGLVKSPGENLMDKTTIVLQELSSQLSECEVYLAELERIILTLAGGRLPPALVPATLLRTHIERIQPQLPSGFSLLYPPTESLWPYYSVLPTSIYFSKDFEDMYVHISVPIQDSSNDLQLYRVHNLPLKVRGGYSVTADINTEYLLVGRGGEYHLELSKEDFQDCQTFQKDGQNFFCGFKPLLQSSKHQTCVVQLFNVEGDGAMCQSKVTHGLVQPFNRLYNGSWVFAALSSQVPVVLMCPNSTTPTSLLGFGVINLMEGCTLSSLEYLYPHTFSGYSDVNLSLEIGEEKVTNHSTETSETGSSLSEPEPGMNSGEKGETTTEYDVDNSSGLHQIETYDDYENGFETMIISAVVAEEESESDGNSIDVSENYYDGPDDEYEDTTEPVEKVGDEPADTSTEPSNYISIALAEPTMNETRDRIEN
ncbi:uncharacterized protein LOC111707463 isoform X2 [Eurytemora carolleeae]|uniref:uncharacterized protein LOC111707463 isoform X2 n=1 Tax=Eurytemora carolleeae TaxID=1294199 RepID=UPI000C763ABB|nr:uncharacterized protein LOC111707463 isoform X2 [Eurytemora carolleeae]|eukprot:XP_023336352.1 uncharacterized protein LOC111707463 isoform X2 [Eurytemora affinis]